MIINTLIIIFWLLVIIYILIESYIYGPLTVLCGCVLVSIIVIAGIKIVTGIAPKGLIKTYTTVATVSKKYTKDDKYGEGTTIRGKYEITGVLLCRKYYIVLNGNGKDHTFEIPKSQYNSIKLNSRVLCKINYKENKITKIKMIDKSRILYNPFVQKLR